MVRSPGPIEFTTCGGPQASLRKPQEAPYTRKTMPISAFWWNFPGNNVVIVSGDVSEATWARTRLMRSAASARATYSAWEGAADW
eukprot:677684-Prorocentrum_minimum.AAC.1